MFEMRPTKSEPLMKTEKQSGRLRKSIPAPACPACRMKKNEWPGEGYTHEGETYFTQGCAEGTGCTCVTVGETGFPAGARN